MPAQPQAFSLLAPLRRAVVAQEKTLMAAVAARAVACCRARASKSSGKNNAADAAVKNRIAIVHQMLRRDIVARTPALAAVTNSPPAPGRDCSNPAQGLVKQLKKKSHESRLQHVSMNEFPDRIRRPRRCGSFACTNKGIPISSMRSITPYTWAISVTPSSEWVVAAVWIRFTPDESGCRAPDTECSSAMCIRKYRVSTVRPCIFWQRGDILSR